MGKMLENDRIVDSLLAENPFKGKQPPKHVRARLVNVIIMVMFWGDGSDYVCLIPRSVFVTIEHLQAF